jgi:membrane protein implicated in regulation of membrane protease activity
MQKQLTRLPFVILALALAALVSVPVSAHHGWGGNSEQQSELTGTVEVPVSLAGPHATMKVRVDGQVWDITMAPPNRTQAAGLKEGIIPVGATVTVSGHKNKTANRYEMKTERVTWNGKVFAVYADRQ